jgi:hypothetical protein
MGAAYGEDLVFSDVSTKGNYRNHDNIGAFFGDLIVDSLSMVDSSSNAKLIKTEGSVTNNEFNGLAALAVLNTLSLNRVLIQSSVENASSDTSDLVGNALVDEGNITNTQITDAYYVEDSGFSSTSLIGLDENERLSLSTYQNYDFDSVWVMHPLFNDGLPYLRYPIKTLHFDSNGGSLVSDQPYFPYEGSLAPSEPSLSGYTFNAWTLNDQIFDFSSKSYGSNISLLATYSAIPVDTNTNTPIQLPTIVNQEPIPETGRIEYSQYLVFMGVILILISKYSVN